MTEAEFKYRAHAFNHVYLCTIDNLEKKANNKNNIKSTHSSDPLLEAATVTIFVHGFFVSAYGKQPLAWPPPPAIHSLVYSPPVEWGLDLVTHF